MKKTFQIAIDGYSGDDKSTVAQIISKKLNFLFVNTGAMYRCYALAFINQNVDLNNKNEVIKCLENNKVVLGQENFFLNGEDVTKKISNPEVAAMASKIGTLKEVREKCVKDQQAIAADCNVIMEGRDTTSVVLPNATLKIFLSADVDTRAKRRWEQSNKEQSLETIKELITKRDYQDSHREISPLIQVPDAFVIDTSNLSIDEVVENIIKEFKNRTNV